MMPKSIDPSEIRLADSPIRIIIVKVNSNTVSRIRSLAEETGVSFRGMGLWPGSKPELSGVVTEHSNGDLVSKLETPVKGGGAVLRQRITIPAGITNRFPELRMPRIGLWDRYGGSMPSGWTRWVLERFEFPFIIAARMNTKASIFAEFERRLALSPSDELVACLEQVYLITQIRIGDLIDA